MPQERCMYKKVLDICISFSINNIFNPIFQKEGEYSLSFEEIMTPCEKLVGGGGINRLPLSTHFPRVLKRLVKSTSVKNVNT